MSFLTHVCVCAVFLLWKINLPSDIILCSQVRKGAGSGWVAWGDYCACGVVAAAGQGWQCCTAQSFPRPARLCLPSGVLASASLLWHSCLPEFWALLCFVALQDDLGSSWLFSALALKQVISARVPGPHCWRMVLETRFALRCSSQSGFHYFQVSIWDQSYKVYILYIISRIYIDL